MRQAHMSQTKEIFYQEPYLTQLEATVLSVDGERVILDQTICYPEGGGQGGDTGTWRCELLDTVRQMGRSSTSSKSQSSR